MIEVKKKKELISKNIFIQLLSLESGFNLDDTRIFLRAFERLVLRILISDRILNIKNFMKIYIKDIPGNDFAWDQIHERRYVRKSSKRIVFKVSKIFKDAIREKDEYLIFNDDD